MELRILSPQELRLAYETDLREAFPPSELKPLAAMESLRRRGVYDPLGYFGGDGEALGYILLWKHRDGRYLLIDYLCVPSGRRNGGIGGKLIQAVRTHYPPETVFIGETEAPTGDPGRPARAAAGVLPAQRGRDPGVRLRPLRGPFQGYLLGGPSAGRGGDPPQTPGDLPGPVWPEAL